MNGGLNMLAMLRDQDAKADGPAIELIQTPTVTRDQIRVMRLVCMRRMKREGFAADVIASVFNVSVRTVQRLTNQPQASHAS
jgi:hypothetical protein